MKRPAVFAGEASAVTALQDRLGYQFSNPALLHEALPYRSAAHQNAGGRRCSPVARGMAPEASHDLLGDSDHGLPMQARRP